MKITIEHESFTGTANNLETAYALLDILNQPIKDSASHIADASNMVSEDIPNDKYLTITADDITIGGKSTTKYNGDPIWARNDCMEHVKKADKLFQKEHGASLVELHAVQANNVAGEPIPDTNGKYAWLRCVLDVNGEKKVTPWVFRYAHSSVADCRSNCANDCGYSVRSNSAFRAGLFESAVLNMQSRDTATGIFED